MTTAVVVLSSPTVLSRHIVAGIVTRNADDVRSRHDPPRLTMPVGRPSASLCIGV